MAPRVIIGAARSRLQVTDYRIHRSTVTLSNARSAPARAYFDAGRRLKGEHIHMLVQSESKGILNKLVWAESSTCCPPKLRAGEPARVAYNWLMVAGAGSPTLVPGLPWSAGISAARSFCARGGK